MIKALSHIVLATEQVGAMRDFFSKLFLVTPYFDSPEFVEFVLPSRFRVAFFRPVGKASQYFSSEAHRKGIGLGVTVENVERLHETAVANSFTVSGPPKEHPWGEKSFLLIDPDGNRWEITQTPSSDGMLVNR